MSLNRLKQSEVYRFANLYRDTDAANASYPCLYAVDISFKESWLRENKNKFEKVTETYLALIRKANKASLNHPDKARNKPLLLNDLTSFEDLGRDRKTDKQLHAHAVWFIHPKVVARFNERFEDCWRNSSPILIDGEFVNLAEVVNSIHFEAILPKRNRYKFEEKWETLFTKIGYALKQNERGGKDISHNSNAVGGINMSAWVDTLPKRQSQFGLFSSVRSRV